MTIQETINYERELVKAASKIYLRPEVVQNHINYYFNKKELSEEAVVDLEKFLLKQGIKYWELV